MQVPYYEWAEVLEGGEAGQETYLRARLDAIFEATHGSSSSSSRMGIL